MRRNGYGQRQGAFRTCFFGSGHGTLDGGGMAGNHDLPRRIEVYRFHHFALRGGGTQFFNLSVLQTQNRRHRADALRHGILHQFRTQADEFDRIGKGQCFGSHQRAVFAQAVSGHDLRQFAAAFEVGAVCGDAGSQHQGLGIDGLAD